ncbi:alginate O-acetyltransferase AlgF [Roseivivax sp. GX 12232]|uniref:alginate O-acetyltransferase AlgF n=1 Tax=Roseivivax sp. GX 12232 TaxID=2900547 RepID=UPI001E525908|nr:alginate O-acetyltransferase AlgF [Roseivivax sp. GX 12232]MCE0506964.1 alginate O-acetyltransferase AlgF [Roseivivax sp. GX 12232]
MINRSTLLPLSAALLTAGTALAQDAGLYPEPSSPDASFLRVIGAEADRVAIAGTEVTPGDAGVTPYVEAAPGEVTLRLGEEETTVELGANTHYTFLAGTEAGLIEDKVKDSPAQADLLLYNLSTLESFDLYALEAETAALSDIAPEGHDGVGLKAPLTLSFEVRQEKEPLVALDPVELRRGTATTVVLTGEGAEALAAAATTSTYAQ